MIINENISGQYENRNDDDGESVPAVKKLMVMVNQKKNGDDADQNLDWSSTFQNLQIF